MDDLKENKPIQDLQQGVVLLKQRQKTVSLYFYGSSLLFTICTFITFDLNALWLQWQGIFLHLNYIHVPMAMAEIEQGLPSFTHEPVLWSVIKLFFSIVVTGFIIGYIKQRLTQRHQIAQPKGHLNWQIFIKNIWIWFKYSTWQIVIWLISIIIVWIMLEQIQYKISPLPKYDSTQWIHYTADIKQSQLYHDIDDILPPEVVSDYLLAQAAVLHQPIDRPIALYYLNQLEKFNEDIFKNNDVSLPVIWTMQHMIDGQVHGRLTESISKQVNKLEQEIAIIRWGMLIVNLIFLLILLSSYRLKQKIKVRIQRIQQSITLNQP